MSLNAYQEMPPDCCGRDFLVKDNSSHDFSPLSQTLSLFTAAYYKVKGSAVITHSLHTQHSSVVLLLIRASAQHVQHNPSKTGRERGNCGNRNVMCVILYVGKGKNVDNHMLSVQDGTQAGDKHQEHGYVTASETRLHNNGAPHPHML